MCNHRCGPNCVRANSAVCLAAMNPELLDLIAKLEPQLAASFLAAIRSMREAINFPVLLAALRDGDIDLAIYALDMNAAAFNGYVMERQAGYVQAGTVVAGMLTKDRAKAMRKLARETALTPPSSPSYAPLPSALPAPPVPPRQPPTIPGSAIPGGGKIVFSFEMTNPRAEARIRTEAATRVAGYVEEQVETARRVIGDGFQRGEGPQAIATTIAGRINPVSKKREGGIVGLSDPQVTYVESMRARLLSGDPDELMKVLGRFDKDGKWVEGTGMTLRDRRYDASIKKAIREIAAGKPNPLTRDRVEEVAAKYSDRLLKKRAEDIARTETASGVEMARAEAAKQALAKAGLPDDALTKTWVHQGGIRHARDWHLAANGKTVVGVDTPFILGDGSVMMYPHDPDGGAKNNVACRCRGDQEVDWAFGL